MDNSHNLQRFVDAQNPMFEQVCAELREGYKKGHWMWFIFPQLRGLGHQIRNLFAAGSRGVFETPSSRAATKGVHSTCDPSGGPFDQSDFRIP
jgi:hypothetical protein